MSLEYVRDSKKEVYVSLGMYRSLLILAKARKTSMDEIVDDILREKIKNEYPLLPELQRQINELQKKAIEKLQNEQQPKG